MARKGKGKEAKLSYAGHVLMENRNGLVVNVRLTQATGTAEREAAVEMVDDIPGPKQVTVGADKNYDAEAMVQQLRERKATPHVAQNQERRRSAINSKENSILTRFGPLLDIRLGYTSTRHPQRR